MDALYAAAMRMTRNPADAEDLLQETFMRLYVHRMSYRTIAKFSTWLYTIAINLVRNHARRAKRSPISRMPLIGKGEDKVEMEAPDLGDLQDVDLERREQRRFIEEIMVKIPAHYREPFVLREVHDLSYEEIAAATGLKLGTVRSRINRARAHFRKQWLARFEDDNARTADGGPLQ